MTPDQPVPLFLDPRVWQALIAGVVVAAGWIVTGYLSRREATRLRAERLRDAHRALFAEIRNACAEYWGEGEAEKQAAALLHRMETEPDFVPFIPREAHDLVFESILPRADVLPRQTIDPIVAFYALVRAVGALGEDMRSDRFRGLEPDRRQAIYRHYMQMRTRALSYGQNAMRLIEAYSDGGPEEADRVKRRMARGEEPKRPTDRGTPQPDPPRV